MNASSALIAMLPQHLLLVGIVLLVALEISNLPKRLGLAIGVVSLVAATAAAFWIASVDGSAQPFPGHLSIDPERAMAVGALLALGIPVLLMSRRDFADGEFPALILSSLYGVSLLPVSDSFLTMFLGIEIMSLPVYVLVVLRGGRSESAEAALKYLVLSGMATAMLLMGVSLLYGTSGTMGIESMAQALRSSELQSRAAVVLVLLALFLKGAVVPFHAWAPDAYEAASVPVTAFMATVVKGGVLIATARIFAGADFASPLVALVAVLPLISIFWGNLAAMRQTSLRRMIAYSSIAHAGYLFYALLGAPSGRWRAIVFYVVTYGAANLLAFAVLPDTERDADRDRLESLSGLYHRDPFAAILIAVSMLSLSGLPPFPGFIAKFQIFQTVMAAGYTSWAVIALIGSFLGIYFYLRVIQVMFMRADVAARQEHPVRGTARIAGVVCLVATVVFAVLPAWVMDRF